MVELGLEMYQSGYDMAAYWDNGDGASCNNCTSPIADHMLLDTAAGFRMNPMHFGIEMLAEAQNKSLHAINTTADRVHGFATVDAVGKLELYLINKFEVAMPVTVLVSVPVSGVALLPTQVASMVDTPEDEHWGALRTTPATCVQSVCRLTLPPVSFSRIA